MRAVCLCLYLFYFRVILAVVLFALSLVDFFGDCYNLKDFVVFSCRFGFCGLSVGLVDIWLLGLGIWGLHYGGVNIYS